MRVDGLLDVVIIQPFDILEAPQVGIDLLNKTLNKSSKIKCYQAKDILIKRKDKGVIHYDGDPVFTGTDIDVHIEKKGILILTNPDETEDMTQPNPVLNAFSELFSNINNVRADIGRRGRRIQAINKVLLRKLTGNKPNTDSN